MKNKLFRIINYVVNKIAQFDEWFTKNCGWFLKNGNKL